MSTFTQNEPLTDSELDRLGEFVKGCKGGEAMNLEELDGFFAALIAGPETVMPSEYYREVFGGEMSDTCEFGSLDPSRSAPALTIEVFLQVLGMKLQGAPSANACDLAFFHPDIEGLRMAAEQGCGLLCGEQLRHF